MFVLGHNSTIRVCKMMYLVSSRLIGMKLLARIYGNRIVLIHGLREVAQLPLHNGDSEAVIDLGDVIGHLLRKIYNHDVTHGLTKIEC